MKRNGETADVQTAKYVEHENSKAAHPETLSWLQPDGFGTVKSYLFKPGGLQHEALGCRIK